eukprot:sb/3471294/
MDSALLHNTKGVYSILFAVCLNNLSIIYQTVTIGKSGVSSCHDKKLHSVSRADRIRKYWSLIGYICKKGPSYQQNLLQANFFFLYSSPKMVFGFSCQAIYMCLIIARSVHVRTSDYRVLFFGHTRHLSGPIGEEISLNKKNGLELGPRYSSPTRNRPKQVNNQSELVIFRSRDWLSANQGPVFPYL